MSSLCRFDDPGQLALSQAVVEVPLDPVPQQATAEEPLRPGVQLQPVTDEAEGGADLLEEPQAAGHLGQELGRGAEDVGLVSLEFPRAGGTSHQSQREILGAVDVGAVVGVVWAPLGGHP